MEGHVFGGLKKTVVAVAVATSAFGLSLASGAQAGTASPTLLDRFGQYDSGSQWEDSTTHGAWKAVFDGYGRVGVTKDDSKVLSLRPKVADKASETHAALVVSRKQFGDVDMEMRMKTVDQLREGPANPWEVAWSIWHYQDNTHFYYVILKPNGWEVGKADPAYPGAQRFLATGSKRFEVGKWHDVRVRQVGATMTVWANGQKLTSFKDGERPYKGGRVGVYNEDAKTYFDDIVVKAA